MTHFSCKYMKVAEILPDHHKHKVLIAFDHMRLRLSDFGWAHIYMKLFEELISNDSDWTLKPNNSDMIQKKSDEGASLKRDRDPDETIPEN